MPPPSALPENPLELLDLLHQAHARIRGLGDHPPLLPLTDDIWYDADGNLCVGSRDAPDYVMVDFEAPLMEKTAEILCRKGGNILNVGYGCGLVDRAIERYPIASHTIVEGHPTVFQRIVEEGWIGREKVIVLHDRWENVRWAAYAGRFDGVYFDIFPYEAWGTFERMLWRECILHILKPDTGVLVLYGPNLDNDAVEKIIRSFRRKVVLDPVETCFVDVPFPMQEWKRWGVGRHEVPVYSLRIPSK